MSTTLLSAAEIALEQANKILDDTKAQSAEIKILADNLRQAAQRVITLYAIPDIDQP